MKKTHSIDVTQDENGIFVWEITELPACYTQGKTIPELMQRMIEVSKGSIAILKKIKENNYTNMRLSLLIEYA